MLCHSRSIRTPSFFSLKSFEAKATAICPIGFLCPNFAPLSLTSKSAACEASWMAMIALVGVTLGQLHNLVGILHVVDVGSVHGRLELATLRRKDPACKLLQAMPSSQSRRAIGHAASHSRACLVFSSPRALDESFSLDPSGLGT